MLSDTFSEDQFLPLLCGNYLTDSYYDLDRQCRLETGFSGSTACDVSLAVYLHVVDIGPVLFKMVCYSVTGKGTDEILFAGVERI